MRLLKVFCLGLTMLTLALLLNFIATSLGLTNWYSFLQQPADAGIIDYMWLFGFYPLGLGFAAHYANTLVSHFFKER